MNTIHLASIACLFQAAATAQNAPTQAFREWASEHVHAIASVDDDTRGDADLRALSNIIGEAHVVALGQPFSGGHEPLAMRNRLIRYAVSRLGFTAVALETDLTSSKLLYDHVAGKTTETDSALKGAFSYGFGTLPENLELIQWLRTWNASQPPARQAHLYGIDLTGQLGPYAYRSVEAVQTFLDHAAPDLGREFRRQYSDVIPVFRSDKYVKLSPAEKDAITGKIQDMVALIRRERIPLTASTSRDEYEWALRQALNAAQDDAYLRTSPPEFDWDQFIKSPETAPQSVSGHTMEMREFAMAENLLWVQQREGSRGKILFFANDGHIQTGDHVYEARPDLRRPALRYRPAGEYLRSALGRDLVVIGTYFGHGARPGNPRVAPPNAAGMDGMLSSLSIPVFVMDLHELPGGGALYQWFHMPHEMRGNALVTTIQVPVEDYDAILFIETITPTPAVPKP
jgi:erythromycin esterase